MKAFNYIDALYIVIEYCYWNNTLTSNIKHITESFAFPKRIKLLKEAEKRWNNKSTKKRILLLKKYKSRLKPVY